MTLTPQEIKAAVAYNKTVANVLWKLADLPWPYSKTDPLTEEFVKLVVAFQLPHGLKPDGKLGSASFSAMREMLRQPQPTSDTQKVTDVPQVTSVVPARTGVSNCIIVKGYKIPLPKTLLDVGATASNWIDDGETHFQCRSRNNPVTNIVIHESVTRDAPTTVRVLVQEGYGVHLMVAPDGHISCHNDLLLDQPIHGNQMNGCSVGLEVVNPYTAQNLKPPFMNTIPSQWWTWIPAGAPAKYTTPTDSQMRVLKELFPWLCTILPDCPFTFPTQDLGLAHGFKIPNWNATPAAKPGPGIIAHCDFASHADGRYILETFAC